MAFCKTLISGAKQKPEILWQKTHTITKISTSQGNRVCQHFNCPPQGWDVWEKRIKVQESQGGKWELGHRCGQCCPWPRTMQRGSLVCFHWKKQRQLWAHKASTAVPRELETLECGCKNQDFINRGRRRENGQLPEPSTVIRGIFLKSMSGKEQKIWSLLAIQQILCAMSLTVQERKRSCFH